MQQVIDRKDYTNFEDFVKALNALKKWCFNNQCILINKGTKYYTHSIVFPTLTDEEKRNQLRNRRKRLLSAFDKWEKAVLRNRELDDEHVMQWYVDLLDLKESAFNNIPERIAYYL